MPSALSRVAAVDTRTISIESPNSLLVIKNGQVIDQMTPECALSIAQVLIAQARKAMETRPRVAEKVAMDSALLLRLGVPVGLSDNLKIQDMARNEAAWNRDLRRAIPGGIRSEQQFGAPALKRHDPKE